MSQGFGGSTSFYAIDLTPSDTREDDAYMEYETPEHEQPITRRRLKRMFPTQRKYKLQPRGDGTFQVLERINDNAYKLDLPTAYGEEFDSRTNPLDEGGNDRNSTNKDKDPLHDTGGPMTISKTKNEEAIFGLEFRVYELGIWVYDLDLVLLIMGLSTLNLSNLTNNLTGGCKHEKAQNPALATIGWA
ncbi:hypothetical protein CR513_00342, partial [Mucuna pruriens]